MSKVHSCGLREYVVAAMATDRSCRKMGLAFDVVPNWWRCYRWAATGRDRLLAGAVTRVARTVFFGQMIIHLGIQRAFRLVAFEVRQA